MSDEKRRIAELEAEIDLLRRTTSEALEKSWEEMERLHREAEESHLHVMTMSMHHRGRRNSNSRNSLTSLQFDNKMPNTSGNIPDIMSIVTDDTVSSSLADDNSQNWSLGNSLRNLGVVGSWRGGAKRQAAVQTQIEKDLMRQLEVMQNDKISTEEDLMLKIRQRESAIETLEGMVVIQDQTIQNLRNEMEEMKKRHEGETKVKSRKEDKKQMSLRRLDSTEQEGKFSPGLAKSSARPGPDDSTSENSVGSLHAFTSANSSFSNTQRNTRRFQAGSNERSQRSPTSRADKNEPFVTSSRCGRYLEEDDHDRGDRKFEVRHSRGRSCERPGRVTKNDAFAERGRRGRSYESPTRSRGTKNGEHVAEQSKRHLLGRSCDERTTTSRGRREAYRNNGAKIPFAIEFSTAFKSIPVPQPKSRSQISSLNKQTARLGSSSSPKRGRGSQANSTASGVELAKPSPDSNSIPFQGPKSRQTGPVAVRRICW